METAMTIERLGPFRWGLNWRVGGTNLASVSGYARVVWGSETRAIRVAKRMLARDKARQEAQANRRVVKGD